MKVHRRSKHKGSVVYEGTVTKHNKIRNHFRMFKPDLDLLTLTEGTFRHNSIFQTKPKKETKKEK